MWLYSLFAMACFFVEQPYENPNITGHYKWIAVEWCVYKSDDILCEKYNIEMENIWYKY